MGVYKTNISILLFDVVKLSIKFVLTISTAWEKKKVVKLFNVKKYPPADFFVMFVDKYY